MRNPEMVANQRPVIAKVLARAGLPGRNLLHGSVLGHPLHSIVTDVPIDAGTVTAALDGIERAGGPAIGGADAALGIGLAGRRTRCRWTRDLPAGAI